MYSQIEIFDAERAKDILEHHNPRNRPLSRTHVRRKLDEMLGGRWLVNPQGVSFDAEGNLLDGQHTLAAIVEGGLEIELYAHHDVPAEVQTVMDQGLGRTAAQVLAMETGAPGAARLTSAARAVLEHGLEHGKPSNTAVVRWATAHAEVLQKYAAVGKAYTAGTHAAFVFADLVGLRHVEDAATRLVELRWNGDDDPMRALARSLGSMGNRDGARAKQTRFFTALNALRAVDLDESLAVARRFDTMPAKVREAVKPELAA